MSTVNVELLPRNGKLGRHIEHDSRSLRYVYPHTSTEMTDVAWPSHIPVLDQGNVGACTGFAAASCLGHDPYYGALAALRGLDYQQLGEKLYESATRLDSIAGSYPPDDTGSTGLAAAKACKVNGFISGYTHITAMDQLLHAVQQGPVIVGTAWYESMFEPDESGLVTVDTGSGVAGGHEYLCDGMFATGEFTFTNSWGPDWGVSGRFCMSYEDLSTLLADDGDATVFVPITQPAPTPTPAPTPAPVPDSCVLAAYKALKKWARKNGVK